MIENGLVMLQNYGDQALLVEGIPLDDPVAYTEAVTKLMK